MASIQNVRLEIVENQGSAVAQVSYTLTGSQQDADHQHAYREVVELIGVDEGPGEDGQNELIPGGLVFNGAVTFANTTPINRPPRLLPLPSSALDEDPGRIFPNAIFPKEDEIRARVTLTQIPPPPVIANSNLVRRGGLFISNTGTISA
jgi:hypothetical protein